MRDLEAIPEVKKTYLVDGVYDLVVHLEAESMEELKNAVTIKIAGIEEFRSSMTLVLR